MHVNRSITGFGLSTTGDRINNAVFSAKGYYLKVNHMVYVIIG